MVRPVRVPVSSVRVNVIGLALVGVCLFIGRLVRIWVRQLCVCRVLVLLLVVVPRPRWLILVNVVWTCVF